MNKEMLLEFRSIYDNDILKYTKVEITTNKNTYTDIWSYEPWYSKNDNTEYRTYEIGLKQWCRKNKIDFKLYFNLS